MRNAPERLAGWPSRRSWSPFVVILLFGSSLLRAAECRQSSDLPTQLPIDAYVFSGSVLEPVLPRTATAEQEGSWVMRVQVRGRVHMPGALSEYDVLLQKETCSGITRQELIDRFVTGDEVTVAAYGAGDSRSDLLLAPEDWVRLVDENVSHRIDTPFEYFETLFDLERRETDNQRAGAIRRIADYLDSEQLYREVVDAYIENRRLKKQLRTMYRALHPD